MASEKHGASAEIEDLKSNSLYQVKAIINVGDFAFVVDVKSKGLDMGIKFQIPSDYPSTLPECIVKSQKLTADQNAALQEVLTQEANQLRGGPMISQLFQKSIDWTLETNLDLEMSTDSSVKSTKPSRQKKKKPKGKDPAEEINQKLPSMKTAEQVISRILWDENLPEESFVIGYIDRFVGVVEKTFDSFSWEDIASVDYNTLAIPKHRIQYFKYNGLKVWDKNERLDNVFGSTGSGTTINDVIEKNPCKNQSIKSPDVDDADSDDDDDVVIKTGLEQQSEEEQLRPREKYWGKKVHPTHFLALRISCPEIHEAVATVQRDILEMEPTYKESLMPTERLHITLCCLGLDTEEQLEEAAVKVEKLSWELKLLRPQDIKVEFEGVDHFHGNCLFAKVKSNAKLTDFVHYLRRRVVEIGLEIRDIYDFVPHMTILKLMRKTFVENRTRYFDARIYNSYKGEKFGSQIFDNINLCAMSSERSVDGFYETSASLTFP